ncbi:MAG TPA: AraC family transcriptional regulator [Candidatus Acidoferrum sp.]|nr:AraC family transcriptional regulator [Candidatus Acidoferrum sp.]
MNATEKANWFVENHFAEPITLELVAEACNVSPYHLTRLFTISFGTSIMRYVRRRRLTEAAKALAAGAPDILAIALDAGYNSHEAFTRAFREAFGVTPESLRSSRSLKNIPLTEPQRMKLEEISLAQLQAPRFETMQPRLYAGISARYTAETCAAIPSQWQKFVPFLGSISTQVGRATYGILCNSDNEGNVEYICGVEVSSFSGIPDNWRRLRVEEQRYAVFPHEGHVSAIRSTWLAIFDKWLPESGYRACGAPEFERYTEKFDPVKGIGGIEIWIPVRT